MHTSTNFSRMEWNLKAQNFIYTHSFEYLHYKSFIERIGYVLEQHKVKQGPFLLRKRRYSLLPNKIYTITIQEKAECITTHYILYRKEQHTTLSDKHKKTHYYWCVCVFRFICFPLSIQL